MTELVKTGLAINDDANSSIVSGVSGNAIKAGTSPRLLCGDTFKLWGFDKGEYCDKYSPAMRGDRGALGWE